MDIQDAYREVGTYRGAADVCATTPKTVKRVVTAADAPARVPRTRNYESVREVVATKVDRTKGRISAKRLLPLATAAGYEGSPRNFRRLVAEEKLTWRKARGHGRRPGVWVPGDVVCFDWGQLGSLYVFCAVLAFSRIRFVYFADNCGAEATLTGLAACFEYLGGVPKVALTDRMGCLRADTVADVVVPTPDYVRFAAHYGFRPDFCLAADPESKGLVENLVGYVKSDFIIPEELEDAPEANQKAPEWMAEVNTQVHSEICAVPLERLTSERPLLRPLPSLRPLIGKSAMRKVDKLSCVRFGSARYSVPNEHIGAQVAVVVAGRVVEIVVSGEVVAAHDLVVPGETSVKDEHYGGPRPAPKRAVRPKSDEEKAFVALGPVAVEFVARAAAAGSTTLASDLRELAGLESAHGRDVLVAAIERAVEFSRFRASDVRSIIEAGLAAHRPAEPGSAVVVELPSAPKRPLSDYAASGLS